MRIIYHNRNRLPADQLVLPETSTSPKFDLGPFVTYIPTLEGLLERSDVVSLNLPLNDKTKGSFGRKQFAKMKKGAVLVNTARGGVVDEDAMIEALESGQVGTSAFSPRQSSDSFVCSCSWAAPDWTSSLRSQRSIRSFGRTPRSASCLTWVPRPRNPSTRWNFASCRATSSQR